MDGSSQVGHAAALAVRTTTWLWEQEAKHLCSTKVQQPPCPRTASGNPIRTRHLRE